MYSLKEINIITDMGYKKKEKEWMQEKKKKSNRSNLSFALMQ